MSEEAKNAKEDLLRMVRGLGLAAFQWGMAQWAVQRAYDRCVAAGVDPVKVLKQEQAREAKRVETDPIQP